MADSPSKEVALAYFRQFLEYFLLISSLPSPKVEEKALTPKNSGKNY